MKFTACLLIAATSAVPLRQTQLAQTKSKWFSFSGLDDAVATITNGFDIDDHKDQFID